MKRSGSAESGGGRLESVDLLRGIVMILMALDHVRDFFGHVTQNPTDMATTTGALFFTRWITHFCAPGFFLLTGLGAGLSRKRRGTNELRHYLITRGLWLLFLDAVLFRCLIFQFNFDFRVTVLTVLWALGWAMIVLGLMLRFAPRTIAITGAALVVLHNLFDGVSARALGAFGPVWSWLHAPGFLVSSERFTVLIAYPIIPWVGVTMLGYVLAGVYEWSAARRTAFLYRSGAALFAAFLIVRGINLYGDPSRWSVQPTPGHTLISFFNTTKYPPSLLFLLMTLGPALVLLAALDGIRPRLTRPAWVLGRVPMFYYLGHFFLIHLLAVLICYQRLGAAHWLFESPDLGNFPFVQPPGWGFDLPVVYLIWVSVVALMYPLCRWYAHFKREHDYAWLGYL